MQTQRIQQNLPGFVLVLLLLGFIAIMSVHRAAAQSPMRIVSGSVTDLSTGEPLPFTGVYCLTTGTGTQTDEAGKFTLRVPETAVSLEFRYLGYVPQRIDVPADEAFVWVALEEHIQSLREVVILDQVSRADEQVRAAESGVVKMKMSEIDKLPSIGGEVDIIKVVQLLPGVTQGGEGSTSLFVRGGDADQNLILYDDATLYGVSHLFGFFSVFNPDVIDEVSLYKGGFPSRFGGRLSSILDINSREGNNDRWGAQGGIGLLSSRLCVEGPVVPGKVSLLVAGRRAYIDRVFKVVGLDVPYYFYDLNARVDAILSHRDRLIVSAYYGYDVLKLNDEDTTAQTGGGGGIAEPVDFGFKIGNYAAAAKWKHSISTRMESSVRFSLTSFNYRVGGGTSEASLYVQSNIRDFDVRPELIYRHSDHTRFNAGVQWISHRFEPNIIQSKGEVLDDILNEQSGTIMQTMEGAVYVGVDHEIPAYRSRVSLSLRQSMAAVPKRNYTGFEPRFNYRFALTDRSSLKASYSLMRQYMHRVSSSNVILPTDLWYPVTAGVKPQRSHQVAMSWEQALGSKETVVSIEGYMKWMNNLTEYREGANLIMNNRFEDELLQGSGTSKGLEFMVKRNRGRFSGWISYTLSKTDRYFREINQGEVFPAKYDRRHCASIVLNYEITERLTFSSSWVYLSGSRFTALLGNYFAPNSITGQIEAVPVYSKRNEIELSDSHRLDVNFSFGPKPGNQKRFQGTLNVGAYNVYARALPYRVNLTPTENGKFKYTQPGLIGFIFNISYDFKF